jgi:RNA 2',3'-cyclic 3'-phosphodiesterase
VTGRNGESRVTPFRVFCAIELPDKVRDQIQKHIELLRVAVPESQASWSRVENIHLTFKFFGNVHQNRIPDIANAATRAVSACLPFELQIARTGAFPKPSQPRVLWIGIEDPTGTLAGLHRRFEDECTVAGFEKENRAFRPHLTIARIRKPQGARSLAEANERLGFEAANIRVEELVVFRSELSSEGSKYTALSRHKMSDMV